MAKPDLFNHRKFKRLARILHPMPFIYIRAHLEAMWDVGYKDGNPYLGSLEDVESSAEWQLSGRKPGEWFDAVKGEFIDDLGNDTYQIHDLFDHAPEYVKKRKFRHDERKNKDLRLKTADNGGQRRTLAENGKPPAPAPAPAPKENLSTDSCTVAVGEAVPPTAVFNFPVIHKADEPAEWPLTPAYVNELSQIFEGVDVRAQCRRALGWVNATNPPRRKTARGMKKFLFDWMSREANQGRGSRLAGMSGPNGDDAARRRDDTIRAIAAKYGKESKP